MSLINAVVTVVVDGEQKEKFRINLPNVRKLQGYLKGNWNLAAYDSCFPKRNRLGDVDGSLEVNGYTLHVEFKESKHALTQGQVLKAIRQAKYSGIYTVFVFGKKDLPVEYLFFKPEDLQPEYIECTEESLKAVLKEWADFTEANSLVTDKTAEWGLTNKYAKGKGAY